ncbi:hypothetical protein MTO96_001437 [Rhipicephalus appendiculatus]
MSLGKRVTQKRGPKRKEKRIELKFQAAQNQASEQSDDFGAGKGAVCVVCGEGKDQPPPSRAFSASRPPPPTSSSSFQFATSSPCVLLGPRIAQTNRRAPRCFRCRHRQHAETMLVEEAR